MKCLRVVRLILLLVALARADVFFVKLTPLGQQQLAQQQLFKPANIAYKTFNTFQQNCPPLKNWVVVQADSQHLLKMQTQNWLQTIEPVGRFKIFPLSNDSLVTEQWYLERIDVPTAWQITQGTPDIILAIIDTGIDYQHPDLQTCLWTNSAELQGQPGVDDDGNGLIDDVMGWDFTDAPRFADGGDYLDPDPDPMDEFLGGHGTEIAGIIAASVNNQRGIAGIAPQIRIMNLRAGTASGYLEEDDVIQAMLYAYANGARIINMSFGDVKVSTVFKEVVRFLWSQGITFVAAAGNEGQPEVYFPAALTQTIAVGSCDQQDHLSGFSNFGYGIDLLAPGTDILSTAPGGKYRRVNGTSFSAPMVAATCALLLSANPQLSNEQLRTIVKSTAEKQLPNPDWQIGAGRLNAGKALQVQYSGRVQILAPEAGQTFIDAIAVVGSAVHPDLKTVLLEWGLGQNPENWQELGKWNYRFFYQDTLALLPINTLPDTLVSLRLKVQLLNGTTIEDVRQVQIDRSPPQVLHLTFDPAFQKSGMVGLLHLVTDDPTTLHIKLIQQQSATVIDSLNDDNRFVEHFVTIDAQRLMGIDYLKLVIKNSSGLQQETQVAIPEIFSNSRQWFPWQKTSVQLPAGYLLPQTTDVNGNGQPEIVLSPYNGTSIVAPLQVFEGQTLVASFNQKAIPRAARDMDGDGRQEVLVTYGNHARLLKLNPGQNTLQTVWQDSSLWAAQLADCNQNGKPEIIGYRDSTYQIFEDQGGFHFVPIASLRNNSKGENRLGSPTVRVYDFNGDGQNEIVFGDYDGDVQIYSVAPDGTFYFWQTLNAYQSDATDLLATGDRSLFVLSHTSEGKLYESELAQLYWTLDIFTYDQRWRELRLKQRLHFYPYFSKKNFDAGLNFYEHNGKQWLFVSVYPSLFVLQKIADQWQVVWQTEPCRSNAVLAGDFNHDGNLECLFNDGQNISTFSTFEQVLSAPFNLSAFVTDSNTVQVQWQGVNYGAFNLYRGSSPQHLAFLTQLTENHYLDRDLPLPAVFYYAVSAVNDSLESQWSNVDSAVTAPPPKLLHVQKTATGVFLLSFDQTISFRPTTSANVRLKRNRVNAHSVVVLPKGSDLLAVFPKMQNWLSPDTLQVQNVFNSYDIPLNPQFSKAPVDLQAAPEPPFVTQLTVENRQTLLLTFSQPMDTSDVCNVQFYKVSPFGQVNAVQVLNPFGTQVRLRLSVEAQASGFGQPVYLTVGTLRNRWGIPMEAEQTFSLFRPTENLQQVVIYPQPVRPEDRELIFAKLPEKVQIQIFNLNGLHVKTLKKVNEYGGIRWNLCDELGKPVASGIYFYRISNGKQQKVGKLVIVR